MASPFDLYDPTAEEINLVIEQQRRAEQRERIGAANGVRSGPTPVSPARNTKFGNQVTLDGNNVEDIKRILEVDLLALEAEQQWHSGSWVLTVNTEPLILDTVALIPPALDFAVIRVQFGSGGITHTLYMNASPSAEIQFPASSVVVDALWDPEHTVDFHLPTEVIISAVLQRGSSNYPARRTIYLSQTSGAVIATEEGLIPNFARRFQMFGQASSPSWLPGTSILLFSANTNSTVLEATGLEARNMFLIGEQFRIPGGATHWRVTKPAVTPSGPWGLDFEVGL